VEGVAHTLDKWLSEGFDKNIIPLELELMSTYAREVSEWRVRTEYLY
jgi:hypothetical protein